MSTQFCDRYRERNVVNPREMLALRNSKVDLSKWEPVSFGHTPPSKVKTLAALGTLHSDWDLYRNAGWGHSDRVTATRCRAILCRS